MAARLLDEATVYDDEGEDSQNCWPSFIDSPWRYDDLAVVPLTTPWQLQEEGSRMQHCVGSYASHCLFYGAHIFSIREQATAKSLSTFELLLDDAVMELREGEKTDSGAGGLLYQAGQSECRAMQVEDLPVMLRWQ